MSIFVDKKFDQMDWISQAVEPYETHVNGVLSALPDCIVVDPTSVKIISRGIGLQINKENVLDSAIRLITNETKLRSLNWDERQLVYDCYEFDVVNGIEIDHRLDAPDFPVIKLNKMKFCFEEEQSKRIIITILNDFYYNMERAKLPFVMDLARLFLSQSSIDTKVHQTSRGRYRISGLLALIFSEYVIPSSRLRSELAAIDFTRLLTKYAQTGSESVLMEIMRIKMMIDNGQAIYVIGGSANV